jgi:geranylgeranylglycerol-phosphate geranylgeranyltransferase
LNRSSKPGGEDKKGRADDTWPGTPAPLDLFGLLEIPRPINCVISFLSVLLGGWLGTQTVSSALLLAAVSAALITGGGNVLNDLCGISEDRINKPQRPLPSGRVSTRSATILACLLLLCGLMVGFSLPAPAPIIVVFATICLILYNCWLKRVVLIGNLVVSGLGGLAFLYGGFVALSYPPSRWTAVFATLFHLGREILKDLEDLGGDQILSGSTVPLLWGKSAARTLITLVFSVLILLTPLPAIIDIYGSVYLAGVSILDLLLIYVILRLHRGACPATLTRLNHLLKASMILGLCAFFFDRLWS